MDAAPRALTLQRDFQHDRALIQQQRLEDAMALHALAQALLVAVVIGENFGGAIMRRQLQQEDIRLAQGAIGAGRHARMGQELAVKHGLAFEARAEADIDDTILGFEQRLTRRAYARAPEPHDRRQMGMGAEKFTQLGLAHPGRLRQRSGARKSIGRSAHPRREPIEQLDVAVLAAVIEIRPAALAGAQARRERLFLRLEQPHILRLGRMHRAGRQAVDAGREHADHELAVKLSGARLGPVPREWLAFHGQRLAWDGRGRLPFCAFDIGQGAGEARQSSLTGHKDGPRPSAKPRNPPRTRQ